MAADLGRYLLKDRPPSTIVLAPGRPRFFGIESRHKCQPISQPAAQKNFATVSLNETDAGPRTPISVVLCDDAASVGPFRSSWRDVNG